MTNHYKEAFGRHANHYKQSANPEDAPNVIIVKLREKISGALVKRFFAQEGITPESLAENSDAVQECLVFENNYTPEALLDRGALSSASAGAFLNLLTQQSDESALDKPLTDEVSTQAARIERIGIDLAGLIYSEVTRGRNILDENGKIVQASQENAEKNIQFLIDRARTEGVQNIDPIQILSELAEANDLDLKQHLQDNILGTLKEIATELSPEVPDFKTSEGIEALLGPKTQFVFELFSFENDIREKIKAVFGDKLKDDAAKTITPPTADNG